MPEREIQCPYCWESIVILIDDSAGEQAYVEDCQVCCRPIEIRIGSATDGCPWVSAQRDDE